MCLKNILGDAIEQSEYDSFLYHIVGTSFEILEYDEETNSLILITEGEPLNFSVSFDDIKKLEEQGISIIGVCSNIDGTLIAKINN